VWNGDLAPRLGHKRPIKRYPTGKWRGIMGNQEEGKLARAQWAAVHTETRSSAVATAATSTSVIGASSKGNLELSSRSHRCSPVPLPPHVCLPGAWYGQAYATWGQQSPTLRFVKCDWLCGYVVDVCGRTARGGRYPGGETERERIRLGTCNVGPLNIFWARGDTTSGLLACCCNKDWTKFVMQWHT
jgi:hypothetical protein